MQVLNERQHELAAVNEYNFDHPDAFDFELLYQTLLRLKEMKKVEVPIYNFVTHRQDQMDQQMNQCCGSRIRSDLKLLARSGSVMASQVGSGSVNINNRSKSQLMELVKRADTI